MPEDLPVADSIKSLESKEKKQLKGKDYKGDKVK